MKSVAAVVGRLFADAEAGPPHNVNDVVLRRSEVGIGAWVWSGRLGSRHRRWKSCTPDFLHSKHFLNLFEYSCSSIRYSVINNELNEMN